MNYVVTEEGRIRDWCLGEPSQLIVGWDPAPWSRNIVMLEHVSRGLIPVEVAPYFFKIQLGP